MSAEQIAPPEKATDVRTYHSASGTYINAADLARVLRDQVATTDAITALVLPNVALFVEKLAVKAAS